MAITEIKEVAPHRDAGRYYDADDLGTLAGLPGTGIIGLMLGDQLHPPMVNNELVWADGLRWKEGALECTRRLADMVRAGRDEVLDVGSGIGGPAFVLARDYNCEVTGINLSNGQVEVANTRAKELGLQERAHFQYGDAQEIPFADERFDVVWTYNMFYHVRDKSEAIMEFGRVLRSGGRVAFDDWLLGNKATGTDVEELQYHWNPIENPPAWMNEAEMRESLFDSGFNVTDWQDYTHVGRIMARHFEKAFERDWRAPIVELVDGSRHRGMGNKIADDFKTAINTTIEMYNSGRLKYVQFVAEK